MLRSSDSRALRNLLRAGLLIALATAAAPGCGGNGNTSTPTYCADFRASGAPAPGAVVARKGSTSTCATLVVELVVSDVTALNAAGFVVTFDPDVAVLSTVSTTGSILASGGTTVANLVTTRQSGVAEIALSRLSQTGVDAVGAQLLATLVFVRQASAEASGSLQFSETKLFDASAPPVEIPSVWSGGTISVIRD